MVVLEAGPDYGPFGDSRWPADLLDARALGYTHDWNYASGDTYPNRVVNFERAKVIGGCSSHNGCAAIWGSRVDYDGWADMGLAGWSSAELLPVFARAAERLRVRRYARHEVTPFQQACLDAAPGAGIPLTDDLNDFDQDEGMATSPVNILDGTRWNAAFAYLDPVRQRPNLTIAGSVNRRSPRHRERRGAPASATSDPMAPARFPRRGSSSPAARMARRRSCCDRGSVILTSCARSASSRQFRCRESVATCTIIPRCGCMFRGTPRLEAAMTAFARAAMDAGGADDRQDSLPSLSAISARIRSPPLPGRRA